MSINRIATVCTVFLLLSPTLASARVLEGAPPPSRRTIRSDARQKSLEHARKRKMNLISLPNVYSNTDIGVSIRYPAQWEKQELLQEEGALTLVVMFLSTAMDRTEAVRKNINLVLEDLAEYDMSLEEYTQIGLQKEMQLFEDFTLLSSGKITLAGKPAQQVHFTVTANGITLRFKQVWFLHKNQAHVWTFADTENSFSDGVITFDRMLETMTVK